MFWDSYKQFTKPRYFLRLQGWYDSEIQKRMIGIRLSFETWGWELRPGLGQFIISVRLQITVSDAWLTSEINGSLIRKAVDTSVFSPLFSETYSSMSWKEWPVVSPTSNSLTYYVFTLLKRRNKRFACTYWYTLFSQPWYKKVRYTCIYLVLSATYQAKAVRELT